MDASVLVAGLMSDGEVRHALLSSAPLRFVAPDFVLEETISHSPKIARRAGLPIEVISAVLSALMRDVEQYSRPSYASKMEAARKAVEAVGAEGDEDYVALALFLEAPIWTLDRDFSRVSGIEVLSTHDIRELETAEDR